MKEIENVYLQKIMDSQCMIAIFLNCNVKLTGTIYQFDKEGILLCHEGRLQYVYKNAISTISTGSALKPEDLE